MQDLAYDNDTFLLRQTAKIVATYASANRIPPGHLTSLINRVHTVIAVLHDSVTSSIPDWAHPSAEEVVASIGRDGLISFIDGRPYKTLKRHVASHGLTPERYRARYGLPADYPMVAPGYAARRSQIAKALLLGHKPT